MKRFCLTLILTIGVIFLVNAQEAIPIPDARPYYVGLQTASNWYEIYYSTPFSVPRVVKITPFLVTAGFYIKPRVAVQVGFCYNQHTRDSPGATGLTLSGQHLTEDISHEATKQTAIPLVLRYSLSKRRPRLRADALLGLAWVYHSFTYDIQDQLDGKVTKEAHSNDRASQFYLTAGISGRYVFNRHFEAVADVAWNRNLKNVSGDMHQQVTGNTLGLTRSTNIGLRYRFNLHKPAPATP